MTNSVEHKTAERQEKTRRLCGRLQASSFDEPGGGFVLNPSGAANFCIWTFKPLDRSFGYGLRGF